MRSELEIDLKQTIEPEALVDAMLSSGTAWRVVSCFETEVLLESRSIERRRAENKNNVKGKKAITSASRRKSNSYILSP